MAAERRARREGRQPYPLLQTAPTVPLSRASKGRSVYVTDRMQASAPAQRRRIPVEEALSMVEQGYSEEYAAELAHVTVDGLRFFQRCQ